MSSSDYSTFVWYNENANIQFTPTKPCNKAIIHFCINGGAQQNIEMTSKNNVYYFAINGITSKVPFKYSFTYFLQNFGAVDTQWYLVNDNPVNTIVNKVVDVVKPVVNKVVDVVKPDEDKWIVTFFDDFNGPLDRSKWNVEVNNDGLKNNNEQQAYIDDNSTVRTENGCLVLQANRANAMDRNYTSGRINSMGKVEFKYGKIEARIKMPTCKSSWCACWLLPGNKSQSWPLLGEIDIVECVGERNTKPTGAINFGDNLWPKNRFVYETYNFPNGQDASSDFHIYEIIWDPNMIRWFIDGNLYSTKTPEDLKPDSWKLNDNSFFLILNVAVGGFLTSGVKETDNFPDQMLVDWIKVSSWKM